MKTRANITLLLLLFLTITVSYAVQPPAGEPLPNFDARTGQSAPAGFAATTIAPDLRVRIPGVKVDLDKVTGAPKWVASTESFLTGPGGKGRGVSTTAINQFSATDPHRVTKVFISEHHALFGHGPEALDSARIKREFVSPHSGLKSTVWEQQLDGITVFEGLLVSHVTTNDELVGISSAWVGAPGPAADNGTPQRARLESSPTLSAADAIVQAAANVGEDLAAQDVTALDTADGAELHQHFHAQRLNGQTEAHLIWLPMNASSLRLCWDVMLTCHVRGEMFRVLVDAQTGEILVRHCLTDYISDVTYRVNTNDSPSPFSPSYSTPVSTQPPAISRVLVTTPALDTTASPNGWIDDGVNETRGNNVDAHTDHDANDSPDLPRPQGSPTRVFDFTEDLTQSPTTYANAAVVQLFYWDNFMHDRLYELGFTEAAGNFQNNNFGRGGLGNDAVQADAQDGSGNNNANFSTPADGSAGRMQMYIFNGPTPNRDGDIDAEIILHEYTHGLSNRRVGGGVGISALQPSGMGEGWSDFYAMALLSEASDDIDAVYAYGGYSTYQLSGLTQNYYFGIRRYPYCTDMTKNPLTFKDIDPAQASSHSGVPRSPIIPNTANEVHNMGEVWCMALRETRANLIKAYGWAIGNQLSLQLVTDGMNLSPANPTYIQARDAILQADRVDNGGANQKYLWAGFAKRGMGLSATAPANSTTTGVHEAFDVPDDLQISPTNAFTSSGSFSGPFSPTNQIYWLANFGTNTLTWSAWSTQSWVAITPAIGSLSSTTSNSVSVYLMSDANLLSPTSYVAMVNFSNAASGLVQTRSVNLTVTPPRLAYFPLDADPGWPRTSPWAYGKPLGLGGTHGKPDPTAGATSTNVFGVNLGGDYSTTVGGPFYLTAGPFNFTSCSQTKLQFQRWLNSDQASFVAETIDISTNGTTWSGIWTNSATAATVDTNWNLVVHDISAYADNRTNVFVRWGHTIVKAGAFAYSGWNLDDIAFYGLIAQTLSLSVPTTATEGDGVVTGSVTVNPPPIADLTVNLVSSDTNQVTVPVTVLVPAGQSNVVFNLTIIDDTQLDGTQVSTITAAAPAYVPVAANISVYDNESATLTVNLPPTVTEGQGTTAGSVKVSAAVSTNVTISLNSSDTTELQVPASVVIPAGQTTVAFNATVVDDNQIDGPQIATVTAHVQNWTDGTTNVTVLDNENNNLTMLVPASATEGDGVLVNAGTVQISGTLTTNLPVILGSDDTTELTVPASATILAGQTSATFNLTVVDDLIIDGPQTVHVTANAGGFNSGSHAMTINDNDSPPFITTQPTNQTVFSGNTVSFSVVAGGTMPLVYQWTVNSTNIPAATNSMLTYSNVQVYQSGTYAVVITNIFGSITSSNAILTVVPAPSVPIITSINPAIAPIGATVNIYGTNFASFINGNIVFFGAVQAVVTSANATNLVVIVPAGATYAPVTVTVNALVGESSQQFLPMFFGDGTPINSITFSRQTIGAANGPFDSLIGDLDGDGKPDVVIVNIGTSQRVSLFKNISTTGANIVLGTRVDLAPATGPGVAFYGGALADVDGDGKLDILVCDRGAGQIFIYRNTSTVGTLDTTSFAAPVILKVGSDPRYLRVADLDADGKPEIVVGNLGSNILSIFKNIGDSSGITTNSFAPRVDLPTSGSPYDLVIADLDGDGKQDLAVNSITVNAVMVFRNIAALGVIATNSFAAEVDFPALNNCETITTADIDGDGRLDLIEGAALLNQISVFRNQSTIGTMSFAAHVDFSSPGRMHNVASGDFDGDGKPDISLDGEISSFMAVFQNGSTPGSFTTASLSNRVDFVTGNNDWGLSVGDLNGDGRADMVLCNQQDGTINVFQNQAPYGGPPVIIIQPTNQTVLVGDNVTNSVTATGGHLTYQWMLTSTNLPGATSSTLTLPNIQLNQAGNYSVLVTNSFGSVLSSNALITVNPPIAPTITAQPTNLTVYVGDTATFNVTATGTPILCYQWMLNGANLLNQTNATLQLLNVALSQAGTYTVLVTNRGGSVLSSNAVLTVLVHPPAITSQPTNLTVNAGDTAIFNVTATGTPPLIYQWMLNGTNLLNQTNAMLQLLNVAPSQAGTYTVLVTNLGGSFLSSNAVLTVLVYPPVITSQPADVSVFVGSTANFSVTATGSPPLIYQWKVNGTNIIGATNATLILSNVQTNQAATNYMVVVTNFVQSVNSSNATLTVKPPLNPPVIYGFSPRSGRPGTVLTITGTNFTPFVGTNLVYFGAVTGVVVQASQTNIMVVVPMGALSAPLTVTVNGLTAMSGYPFLLTFPGNSTLSSSSIASRLDIGTDGGPTRVALGDLDRDGYSDIVVSHVYESTIYVYRNLGSNNTITTSSFAPPVILPINGGDNVFGLALADLDGDGRLDIIVGNRGNGSISLFQNLSTPGTLTTNSFSKHIDYPIAGLINALTVGDVNGDGKPDIEAALNSANTVAIFQNAVTNNLLNTNSFLSPVIIPVGTGPIRIAVDDIDGDGLPDIITANSGSSASVSVLRNRGIPGNITTSSFTRTDLPGENGLEGLTIGDVDGDGKIDIVVSSSGGQNMGVYRNTSTPGSISAASLVTFGATGNVHNVLLGDIDGDSKLDIVLTSQSTGSLFRNISTTGTINSSSFGSRIDFSAGPDCDGIAIGDVDGDGRPDIVLADANNSTLSLYKNLAATFPYVVTQPLGQSVINTSNVTFTVFATGGWPLFYQWQLSGTNLPGATGTSYLKANIQPGDAGNYSVIVTNATGSTTSSNALLIVIVAPTITLQPTNQNALGGNNVNFTVIANGTPPLNYAWLKNGAFLSAATNNVLPLLSVTRTNSGIYTVIITNLAGSVTSSNAILAVHVIQKLGTPVQAPDGTLFFVSGDADRGALSPSDVASFTAQSSTNLTDWVTLPGALTFTNGGLKLSDPNSTNYPIRFYRILETW